MTACLGAFGSYKLQYSRHLNSAERADPGPVETVWVTKQYSPLDPRCSAPVPRHKHVVPTRAGNFSQADTHWVPVSEPPLRSFNRPNTTSVEAVYVSHPATRSEEWSTLRQMLPSYGNVFRVEQPSWGTRLGGPPDPKNRLGLRLPHVNSCMTNYVDDMHKTHREFRHC